MWVPPAPVNLPCALIASFWEAESGGVRIGGVDVRNIPLPQIMELVSYVSQDNFLFHLSIRENIRIGKPEATDAEIEAAAKKSELPRFHRRSAGGL